MSDRFVENLIGAAILVAVAIGGWLWVKDRGGVFVDYNAENAAYAAAFFDGLFPYDAVLATQRWHPQGGEPWDCTYAVVTLTDTAPASPGTRGSSAMGWQFQWGGDWQPTPAPALGDTIRDALAFCARRLPEGLALRLQAALETTGNFYTRDRVGEVLQLYAPSQGLAAHIRYGD